MSKSAMIADLASEPFTNDTQPVFSKGNGQIGSKAGSQPRGNGPVLHF